MIKTMTNEEYHAAEGTGKSGLDQIARSPAHYKEYLETPRTQTDAFSIGTEAHRLILEPETESRGLLKPDIARRSKADRTLWEDFFSSHGVNGAEIMDRASAFWDAEFSRQSGKYLLTDEQFRHIKAMRESVFAHPSAAKLLERGVAEQSIFWTDEYTGELCRCRPDWIHDNLILVDLKTTDDASPQAFARSVAKYRYHVQDAFYSDGFAAEHDMPGPPPFVFIVVEKTPPYAVGVYELEYAARELGRELYHRDLERLAEAKRTGCWDAYSNGIETIDLPRWAYSQ